MWRALEQQGVFGSVDKVVTGLAERATYPTFGPVASKISFLSHYVSNAPKNKVNDFLVKSMRKRNQVPDLFTPDGFVAGQMLVRALTKGSPTDVDKMISALEGWSFTGPKGQETVRASDHAMPQVTVALMAEAATLEPAVALRRFVENALAPATVAAHPELVDRIMAHRLATAQQPAAWAAQASAGAVFDAYDRLGAVVATTLVQHGDEDVVVDPRNADLLVELLPDVRLERYPSTGHLFFWEAPEQFVSSVSAFLEDA